MADTLTARVVPHPGQPMSKKFENGHLYTQHIKKNNINFQSLMQIKTMHFLPLSLLRKNLFICLTLS